MNECKKFIQVFARTTVNQEEEIEMAIKDNDSNANNNAGAAGGSAMGEAFSRAAGSENMNTGTDQGRPRNQRRGSGVMDINRRLARPMSRKSTGEVVMRYQDAFQKQMERNFRDGLATGFKMVVLDNNTSNVGPLSSLLVCYEQAVKGQTHLAVYTLLIEASGSRLNNRVINMGGRNVEIRTVPGDVFNDYLWNKIVDHVNTIYGRRMEVMDAGAMVLPSEMDPEDDEHVRRVIYNATQACYTVMENNVGGNEEPFSVSWVQGGAETLTSRLDYNPGNAESSSGEPIRSDVCISLQGSLSERMSEGGFEEVRDLSRVDGYVDLVYSPPQQQAMLQQQMMMAMRPGVMPGVVGNQYYYPRFIITRMDSEVDAITMELQLLSLATTTMLTRNMAWAGVFRPLRKKKGIDKRDIGAIGYEVNLTGDPSLKPEKVDTKSDAFGLPELYQLLTATIHNELVFSMDIEEVGELSWIHQAFIAAANGNKDAYQLILDAANNLTNGRFAAVFQGGPIAIDDNVRIPMGYYLDEEGQRRDIRDIDYVAMLNLAGKDDPNLVMKWDEVFNNTQIPAEVRLEEQIKILEMMLGQSLHIKGYARRITFDMNFIVALSTACANAGLSIQQANLIQEFAGTGMRGNFNIGQYAVGSQQVGGFFNYGPTTPWGNQTGQGYYGGFTGRFGR